MSYVHSVFQVNIKFDPNLVKYRLQLRAMTYLNRSNAEQLIAAHKRRGSQ